MKSHLRLLIFSIIPLAAALAWWGCSDDDGPAGADGGSVDTTPPVVSSIASTDNRHVKVEFNENVDRVTAEHASHYSFTEGTLARASGAVSGGPEPVAGDPLEVYSASLGADGKTVTLSTDLQSNAPYDYSITGVKDVSGNAITTAATGSFSGSIADDTTPPTIVARSPAAGATGVGVQQTVVVQFSEPMNGETLVPAFSLTGGGGPVAVEVNRQEDHIFGFQPAAPLAYNTTYTASITSDAEDYAGNPLAPASWMFTTTASVDNTPPTLVSTTPSDGATSVSVTTNISLRFSEAVNQSSLDMVALTPNPGDGLLSWSPDGRVFTFDPDVNLLDDTQYTLIIPEGAVEDLAGNKMQTSVVVIWTTGASFADGSISGTLSGDPSSIGASSPEGAAVLAATDWIFDDQNGGPEIQGATFAAANGDYTISNLTDNNYLVIALLDSNGDDELNPESGDAIGAWGVNPLDDTPDFVTVSSNDVEDIDFQLYDFSVISGLVTYTGTTYDDLYLYEYNVGVFDTTGFDINDLGEPDYSVGGLNMIWDPRYYIGAVFESVPDGTYYVGAYMETSEFDDGYDPAVDPAGFYGTGGVPAPVTIESGGDVLDAHIQIEDPAGGGASSSSWSAPARGRQPHPFLRAVREALRDAKNR